MRRDIIIFKIFKNTSLKATTAAVAAVAVVNKSNSTTLVDSSRCLLMLVPRIQT